MAPAAHWHGLRPAAHAVGDAFAAAAGAEVEAKVTLGKLMSFDAPEMLSRHRMPLRAVMVRFGEPLADVVILLSSIGDEVLRPIAERGAGTLITALGLEDVEVTVEPTVEYATVEETLEQCEALYLEASYEMVVPVGQLRMVMGSGLLQAALEPARQMAEAEIAVSPVSPVPPVLHEVVESVDTVEPAAVVEDEPAELPVEPLTTPLQVSSIDELDAALADQQQAAEAAPASAFASWAEPLVDEPEPARGSAEHWTSLLSGVEVELSAELGRAELALGTITALGADSVLTLDQLVDEPVSVFVNGMLYATARLVVVDGEYGIEILEVVEHGDLASSLAA